MMTIHVKPKQCIRIQVMVLLTGELWKTGIAQESKNYTLNSFFIQNKKIISK
jgi:hypothetical protein